MHLAICADNVADRKQLERLLKRESDKNASAKGILYVDSFGNPKNMLQNPMQYDAFFLDLSIGDAYPEEIIQSLKDTGVQAPIILCAPDFSVYPKLNEDNAGLLTLKKPVGTAALSQIIEQARSIKDSAEPLIEFRVEGQTFYVTEPEILYAVSVKDSLEVHLTKNRILNIQNTIPNLFSEINRYESFFAPSRKAILNGRHICHLKGHKAEMTDGTCFSIGLSSLSYAKDIFHKFQTKA